MNCSRFCFYIELSNLLFMKEAAELIDILEQIKDKVADDSDMLWTRYDSGAELKREIDQFIVRLREGDFSVLHNINVEFLPTSTFQEHSLQNNWSEAYLKFADQFDKIYAR